MLIDVEGDGEAIEKFVEEIRTCAPPLASIEAIERDDLDPAHYTDFRIVESDARGEKFVPVAADTATCEDYLREMRDPADRRYRYPFINCTNCGPRFTIIEAVPYDRASQCGEILKGVKKPWECKVFGTACTPETPIGSCMVSSEGACAAYYNFGRLSKIAERSVSGG